MSKTLFRDGVGGGGGASKCAHKFLAHENALANWKVLLQFYQVVPVLSCLRSQRRRRLLSMQLNAISPPKKKKRNHLKVLEKEQRVRRKSDLLAAWNAICLARVTGRIHDVICHSALRCTAQLISCEQISRLLNSE